MKRNVLQFMIAVLAVVAASCSNESETSVTSPTINDNTYILRLDAQIKGYDNVTTRSDYGWPDKAQLVLQFFVGEQRIHGIATYSQVADQWTVTTSQQITSDTDGDCNAYYFVNAVDTSSQAVTLNAHSAIYQDTEGSFTLTEDNVMIVKLQLSPRLGRVRFKGNASARFGVTGLNYHAGYSITDNKFTSSTTNKIVGSFDKDGDTDYYYVAFADPEKRQIIVDGTGKGAYLRSFGEEVLAEGQSGYITLPSTDNLLAGWTLVNTDNQKEITLPTVSGVTVSKLRSRFATATASVTDLGNGTLSEAGIIYSTNSNTTAENGTVISCGRAANIESRLSSLAAKTTYYVKAFAINERGTTYGATSQFTTLSEEEDGTGFGREEYGEDEDLNGDTSSEGTFNREGYGADEDLNNSSSSSGTIGKDGYGGDDDLNNSASSSGTIGKDGYGGDDDLNNSASSSGTINKNSFGNDENWN